jgi:hypothetical protein
MGSIYAALLADAGHEVWAVDTWVAHGGVGKLSKVSIFGFLCDITA